MAGILIFLIISFMIAFIVTRSVWVRVESNEILRIEIHLPVFALVLTKKNKNKKQKQKKEKELSALTYISIIIKTLKRFDSCELVIEKISPSDKKKEFKASTMTRPYGYQSLIYALIAYLGTKVEKITLKENAVTFAPGNPNFVFDITVKGRLYEIAFGVLCLLKNIKKEKRLSFS